MLTLDNTRLGVIGLGYVGLPLAAEFGKKMPVLGFDISKPRIEELKEGKDSTLEASDEELKQAAQLKYSCIVDDLKEDAPEEVEVRKISEEELLRNIESGEDVYKKYFI